MGRGEFFDANLETLRQTRKATRDLRRFLDASFLDPTYEFRGYITQDGWDGWSQNLGQPHPGLSIAAQGFVASTWEELDEARDRYEELTGTSLARLRSGAASYTVIQREAAVGDGRCDSLRRIRLPGAPGKGARYASHYRAEIHNNPEETRIFTLTTLGSVAIDASQGVRSGQEGTYREAPLDPDQFTAWCADIQRVFDPPGGG